MSSTDDFAVNLPLNLMNDKQKTLALEPAV